MTSCTYTKSLEPLLISQERVILSICIATYNRADFIGATIESIVSQICDDIEIIIVDGASPDNTQQVVYNYQRNFPQIKYYRLPEKGGVDRDYCKAVEFANGTYCWLMSDDDLLKPGAIQAVLNEIRNDYGLILVNAEIRNADLTSIIESKRLDMVDNKVYKPEDSEQLFMDTMQYLSFIGCVVIKRQLWNERNKEIYFGTNFIHVGVIFQKIIPENTLVIAKPLIVIRYGNAQWTARTFDIWMFKWPMLIWSFPDYSDEAKSKACPKEPWRKINALLLLRAFDSYSLKEYSDLLKPLINSQSYKLVAKSIAVMPGSILNALAVIYFSFLRPSPRYILDLEKSRFYRLHWLKKLYTETI